MEKKGDGIVNEKLFVLGFLHNIAQRNERF